MMKKLIINGKIIESKTNSLYQIFNTALNFKTFYHIKKGIKKQKKIKSFSK